MILLRQRTVSGIWHPREVKLLVPVVIETHPIRVYYGEAYVESNVKRQRIRGLVIEYPVDVAARYVNHALQAVCLDGVLQDFEGGDGFISEIAASSRGRLASTFVRGPFGVAIKVRGTS